MTSQNCRYASPIMRFQNPAIALRFALRAFAMCFWEIGSSALLLGSLLAFVSSLPAAEISMEILLNRPRSDNKVVVELRIELEDKIGKAKQSAEALEQGLRPLRLEEKLDALRWHISQFHFVKAEELAKSLVAQTLEKDVRVLYVLGFAQICRGDYESSVISFKKAERLGLRPALHMRLYIASVVLRAVEGEESNVLEIIRRQEMNDSKVALGAVLEYCKFAERAEQVFRELSTKLKYDAASEVDVAEAYLNLCKNFKMDAEMNRFKAWLEKKQ